MLATRATDTTSGGDEATGSPACEPLTIVIADDHAVVCAGLRMLLDAEPGFEVVAQAGNVADAIRAVRGHKPGVLILDLNMPGGSSLDAIPNLLAISPTTAVVVLTMQSNPAFAREALQAGARAYVLKEAAEGELVQAVRMVAAGKTYLNPGLGARIAAMPSQTAGPPDDLTERQVEVLRLIALGYTNSEIGVHLSLSVRTVESHRAHIQHKLGHANRAQLVRYAIANGMSQL
jgi:two-component system response regulator NreC